MAGHLHLTHDYPVPAEELWDLVTRYDALAEVCARYVRFDGLPEGRVQEGQVVTVKVSLFGKLPPQDYRMEILKMDTAAMLVRSLESGAGVKSWKHRFQVVETEAGSQLCEEIEIDAGWLTPVFKIWAGILYRGRHKPRLAMLGVT